LNEVFTNYPALISFKVPHGDAEYLYADPEYMYELFYGWLNLFYEFPKGDQLASIEIQMELQELLDTWATRDLAPRLQALTLALAGTHQGIPSDPKVPLMARGEGGLRQKKLGVLVPGPSQDRKEEKESPNAKETMYMSPNVNTIKTKATTSFTIESTPTAKDSKDTVTTVRQ
jgi:hypothetical protein